MSKKKSSVFYEIRTSQDTHVGYFKYLENAKVALSQKATELSYRVHVHHPGDGLSFNFDTGGQDSCLVRWFIKTNAFQDTT